MLPETVAVTSVGLEDMTVYPPLPPETTNARSEAVPKEAVVGVMVSAGTGAGVGVGAGVDDFGLELSE